MSTQRLGDEPFASDEDLFFHKLFAEDELSQRKASETTSMYVNSTYSFHVCKKKGKFVGLKWMFMQLYYTVF